jgi:hypothetical protein
VAPTATGATEQRSSRSDLSRQPNNRIPQKSGGKRYLCEGGAFPPELENIFSRELFLRYNIKLQEIININIWINFIGLTIRKEASIWLQVTEWKLEETFIYGLSKNLKKTLGR